MEEEKQTLTAASCKNMIYCHVRGRGEVAERLRVKLLLMRIRRIVRQESEWGRGSMRRGQVVALEWDESLVYHNKHNDGEH